MLTHDIMLAETSALSAFVCDFDHILEYGAYCVGNKKKPSLKEFFSGDYFEAKKKIVLAFHSYEYLLLLALAALITRNRIIKGISLGYALHLFGYNRQ